MKCILGAAVLLFVLVLIEEHEALPPILGLRGDSGGRRVQRAAVDQRKWPNDGHMVYIPISFTDVTSLNMDLFQDAIKPFYISTCVWFVMHSTEPDYLNIDVNGCSSLQGRQGGAQRLSLNCESKAEFQRELLHSLGFSYETQRPDRDHFIRIHWENIQEDKKEIFKHKEDSYQTLSLYEYSSVMHFPSTAFSANGKPTLEAAAGSGVQMGSDEMTEEDIKRVNEYYCPGKKG